MAIYDQYQNFAFSPEYIDATLATYSPADDGTDYDKYYLRDQLVNNPTIQQYTVEVNPAEHKLNYNSASDPLSMYGQNLTAKFNGNDPMVKRGGESIRLSEFLTEFNTRITVGNLYIFKMESLGDIEAFKYDYMIFNRNGLLVSNHINTFVVSHEGCPYVILWNMKYGDAPVVNANEACIQDGSHITIVAVEKFNDDKHVRLLFHEASATGVLNSIEAFIPDEKLMIWGDIYGPESYYVYQEKADGSFQIFDDWESTEITLTRETSSLRINLISTIGVTAGDKFYLVCSHEYNTMDVIIQHTDLPEDDSILSVSQDSFLTKQDLIAEGGAGDSNFHDFTRVPLRRTKYIDGVKVGEYPIVSDVRNPNHQVMIFVNGYKLTSIQDYQNIDTLAPPSPIPNYWNRDYRIQVNDPGAGDYSTPSLLFQKLNGNNLAGSEYDEVVLNPPVGEAWHVKIVVLPRMEYRSDFAIAGERPTYTQNPSRYFGYVEWTFGKQPEGGSKPYMKMDSGYGLTFAKYGSMCFYNGAFIPSKLIDSAFHNTLAIKNSSPDMPEVFSMQNGDGLNDSLSVEGQNFLMATPFEFFAVMPNNLSNRNYFSRFELYKYDPSLVLQYSPGSSASNYYLNYATNNSIVDVASGNHNPNFQNLIASSAAGLDQLWLDSLGTWTYDAQDGAVTIEDGDDIILDANDDLEDDGYKTDIVLDGTNDPNIFKDVNL